jgi:hypothetical protein
MSTAAGPVSPPASPGDVVALQYAARTRMLTVPLGILVAVVVVMAVVTLAVVRAGGRAADLDYNGSVIWSLFGFVVALGVQSVAVGFPLALALGSTRRTFTLGTLATAGLQAALLTAAALLLLGLELATGGWFVGARVLSDATLGGGNPFVLAAVMFLSALVALAAGGAFGAAWVRFGARGPLLLGLALTGVLALALLVLGPDLAPLARAFEPWWLAVAAAVAIVLATTGEYLLLRRASVR